MNKEAFAALSRYLRRSALSPDMKLVADSLGMTGAVILSGKIGGLAVRIPMEDRLFDNKDGKLIISALGKSEAVKLCQDMGGMSICIPMLQSLVRPILPKVIQDEYDGGNLKALAVKYGVSQRTAETYLNLSKVPN